MSYERLWEALLASSFWRIFLKIFDVLALFEVRRGILKALFDQKNMGLKNEKLYPVLRKFQRLMVRLVLKKCTFTQSNINSIFSKFTMSVSINLCIAKTHLHIKPWFHCTSKLSCISRVKCWSAKCT